MVPIRKILVPVNGQTSDSDALTLACRVAKQNKATIEVIHVIEVKRTLPLDAEMTDEMQHGEDVLDSAEGVGQSLDCPIDTELLQAREVGPTVVDEARERGADLIILGLTYKKRFGEFDLGRTAPYILKNAHCRVWLCRGDQDVAATQYPVGASASGSSR